MARKDEPGWQAIDIPDGRRGAWIRVTTSMIEFCAGRGGDDAYVQIPMDGTSTPVDGDILMRLKTVLEYYAFAVEQAYP